MLNANRARKVEDDEPKATAEVQKYIADVSDKAHPVRKEIVLGLLKAGQSVKTEDVFSYYGQSASTNEKKRQNKFLEKAGILQMKRVGKFNHYELTDIAQSEDFRKA